MRSRTATEILALRERVAQLEAALSFLSRGSRWKHPGASKHGILRSQVAISCKAVFKDAPE